MKILHLIAGAAPETGGPIKAVCDFNSTLDGVARPTIATLDPPGAPFLSELGAPYIALGSVTSGIRFPFARHYRYSPGALSWLTSNVQQFDVVLVHGLWNYATYIGARVLPHSGVPYFVFPHGMMDPYFRRIDPIKHLAKQLSWLSVEGPLLAGARGVLFTAEDERRLAREQFVGFSSYREVVIGYGTIDSPRAASRHLEAFQAAVPELKGEPFLLYLSRLHPKKGADMLIDAFASIAWQYPKLHLVVAGPDHDDWGLGLRLRPATAGLAHRIHFPGALFGDAKWGALHAADAFVLPSHQENFGLVLAEAMACGTPVLTTRSVNIWREIEASGGGFIDDDTLAGTRALLARWMSLSEEAKSQMRLSARCGYERYFQIQNAAQRLYDLLKAERGEAVKGLQPNRHGRFV